MKHLIKAVIVSAAALAYSGLVVSAELPFNPAKRTQANLYLTASEAYFLKKKNAEQVLFVDIRSPAEIMFVGFPDNADLNIPYFLPDYSRWSEKKKSYPMRKNRSFVQQVDAALKEKNMSNRDSIVLLCRSGKRSARAASMLHRLGYAKVYTVIDGFEGDKAKTGHNKGKRVVNGWKNSQLPWGYRLERSKISLIQ